MSGHFYSGGGGFVTGGVEIYIEGRHVMCRQTLWKKIPACSTRSTGRKFWFPLCAKKVTQNKNLLMLMPLFEDDAPTEVSNTKKNPWF
jgi:hypothetical protein